MKDIKTENLWLMKGDCLERMQQIPSGSVDMVLTDPIKTTDESIVEMYINGMSMRSIARKINTNHKVVSKVLKNSGVATREPKSLRGIRKFDSHKEKMYNNMATHIRFNVSVDWLMQFKDFEKLKTLNDVITNRSGRWDVSTEWYKEYIPKFYNDKNFNLLYNLWIINGREKYKKPSLDHIVPKSKGGTNDIENLQFLSWFENRCKNDMSQEDWNNLKLNIQEYFV